MSNLNGRKETKQMARWQKYNPFRGHSIKSIVFVIVAVIAVAGGIFALWAASLKIPTADSFDATKISQSTKIYDRTGTIVLYDVGQNVTRTVVPFDQISDYLKKASVAIEDQNFYNHAGIEVSSIVRSFFVDLFTLHFTQGGSTITQQVVKNSLLTNQKSIARKLKEWVLAIKLDKELSKDEILNLYLNENPYGGSIYGVEEASLSFFGKHAKEVDLAEAAYLAALPQAPSHLSPYGSHRQELEDRKNLVLKKMHDLKMISDDQYNQAKSEVVNFLPEDVHSIKAPHFVMYIKQQLIDEYGEDMVDSGGLKVITTLDYTLQEQAEALVKQYALDNAKKYDAQNAALVAIDPKTGQILSMVGSRDYFDNTVDGQYNIALAHRQPGSSFKPFVYSEAFIKGYTPDTVLFDVPTEFSTDCTANSQPLPGYKSSDCYHPVNYDGLFRGPMTLRNALAQSINVPAVKLLYLAGIKDSLNLAKSMGISTLGDASHYGLTLVLGGGEVTLLDMTSAYGTFANQGVRNPATGILKVSDNNGNTLEEFQQKSTNVLDPEITYKIDDILSDNVARTPSYGVNSPLYFPDRQVAVKTGTTNDYRDTWILGYTPSIAIGVWAGNNDNHPIDKKVAGLVVAPLWHAVMAQALQTLPVEYFPKPLPVDPNLKPILRGIWQGGGTETIDTRTGQLAASDTPPEFQQTQTVPNAGVHSILYWVDKNNPLGLPPTNPNNDPEYPLWEYGVQQWAAQNGY